MGDISKGVDNTLFSPPKNKQEKNLYSQTEIFLLQIMEKKAPESRRSSVINGPKIAQFRNWYEKFLVLFTGL
jgi:hypothetical protein